MAAKLKLFTLGCTAAAIAYLPGGVTAGIWGGAISCIITVSALAAVMALRSRRLGVRFDYIDLINLTAGGVVFLLSAIIVHYAS